VFEIYRRLTDRLASITVATGAYPGARDETIEGVRYIRLGAARPYYWSRATFTLHASRLLAAGDYDVAVFDFSTYAPIRIPTDRPVGITVHHVTGASASDRWGGTLGRAIAWQERVRLQRGRVFSATSGATELRLRVLAGDTATIVRVGAGVPDELFDLPRADEGYILYFGRFDWFQKGLDTLLEAMSIIVRERPGTRLRMAGRGRDSERVLQAARGMGIGDNVEVLGAVEAGERDDLLAGAALTLMPSRFEGFGMVAAEAMAAGIPVIASDVDSLPEVVDPPKGGILVPAGDGAAFATAALRLLADPAARARMSRDARASAERFRWSRVAKAHLEFLKIVRSMW
jgi:glycosyltransferase involved in cell wall biosynthesis